MTADWAAYARAWRAKNPNYDRTPARRAQIKAKDAAYRATHREYYNNLAKAAARKKRLMFITKEKLRRGACMDCGLIVTPENIVVFDFDHQDRATKLYNISNCPQTNLVAEMAKCDLRCANCHRIKSWLEADYRSRAEIIRMAQGEQLSLFDTPESDTLF